jgi:hypothetical protein
MTFKNWVAALMLDMAKMEQEVQISAWLLEQLFVEGAEPTAVGILEHCEGGRPVFLRETAAQTIFV